MMNESDILQVLKKNSRKIRGAKSVKSRVGSAFTENRDKMQVSLQELKNRRLFNNVDSRTTMRTVALSRQKNRATYARKNRGLDNSPDSKAVCVQIERIL